MLTAAPRIDVIEVSRITALPDFHPEAGAGFAGFPVHVFLVHHPDGPILVDTGVGFGNDIIDEWYRPRTLDLRAELEARNVDPDGALTIINTHLHFDHCGQNLALSAATIVVQRTEEAAATAPFYSVDEWARLPADRTRLVDGNVDVAEGVSVIHTPGHTPGHQAVVVRSNAETVVIAGQCIFRAAEWTDADPSSANLHDEAHRRAAADSLARLRALRPTRVLLSHDTGFTPQQRTP